MNSDSGAGWRLGGVGPGLPLLLLLVFANFLRTDTAGLRPPFSGGGEPVLADVENLPARLWRDPLGAVYAQLGAKERAFGAPSPVSANDVRASFGLRRDSFQIVPVFVPGGTRPEDVELRVRIRHALVAAFGTQGLNAEATDRLGFVELDAPDWRVRLSGMPRVVEEDPASVQAVEASFSRGWSAPSNDAVSGKVTVPFEWYRNGQGQRALVCWLDEDVLGTTPLLTALDLAKQLVPTGAQVRPDAFQSLSEQDRLKKQIHIVGPTDSDVLKKMIVDDRLRDVWSDDPWWGAGYVTSPRSTVDPQELNGTDRLSLGKGLVFERTIGTDPELAQLLIKEMVARLHPFRPVELKSWMTPMYWTLRALQFEQERSGPVRVALVTERDTSYGRAWERLLETAVDKLNFDRRRVFVREQVREIVLAAYRVEGERVEAGDAPIHPLLSVHKAVKVGLRTPEVRSAWVREALGEPAGRIDEVWQAVLTARPRLVVDPVRHRSINGLDLTRVDNHVESLTEELRRELKLSFTEELLPLDVSVSMGSWVHGRMQAMRRQVSDEWLEEVIDALRAYEREDLADRVGPQFLQRIEKALDARVERACGGGEFLPNARDMERMNELVADYLAGWFAKTRGWEILCHSGGAWGDPEVGRHVRSALIDLEDSELKAVSSTFAEMVQKSLEQPLDRRLESWWKHYQFEFEVAARYLRGIDGRVPGDQREAIEPGQEPAVGEAQLDYVRRLERLLDGKDYHAIGVLGNDVYDKLAVLAVLRPRFHRALFFTTDVDARLLPSRANQSTLNLIVASHYGLILDHEHQEGHPPFRSGYQASVYLAAQRAAKRIVPVAQRPEVLDEADADKRTELTRELHERDALELSPRPRVFEIGRTWFHPLEELLAGRERNAEKPLEAKGTLDANDSSAPKVWLFQPRHLAGAGFAALLILLCGARSAWITGGLRGFVSELSIPLRVVSGSLLLGGVVGSVALFFHMESGSTGIREPFLMVEGVSAWPTICVRIAVIGLCNVGFLVCIVRLKRLRQSIGETWFQSADPVWAKFTRTTSMPQLMAWAVGSTLVYYILTGQVFRFLSGDLAPIRGEANYLIERLVLLISILCFVFLLFFVFQIMHATRGLIRTLSERSPNDWTSKTLKRLVDQGLSREAASSAVPTQIANALGQEVQGLIWFPALAMFGMVVSRASLFDRWDWPPALIFTLSLSFLVALVAGHHVRHAAMEARGRSLGALRRLQLRHAQDGDKVARTERLIAELEGLRGGAFAPLLAHPLLRAWLLPLAGLGTNSILEAMLPTIAQYTG